MRASDVQEIVASRQGEILSVDDMAAQGSLTGADRALVVSSPAPGFLQR
jgi:hypothetical protein